MPGKNSVVFIMPRPSNAWRGSEALWITVAGWSAAAKRKFGSAWVITPDRIAQPEEAIHYPLNGVVSNPGGEGLELAKWIPPFIKTIVKDLLLRRRSKSWNILGQEPWKDTQVRFIWQQHDLFPGPGRMIANKLKVPLVTFVHAPIVWESSKWGVKRYLWGWFLERFIEARALRQSDVVACVSDDVAAKLKRMGIKEEQILVSPMAVDPYLFESHVKTNVTKNLDVEDKLVIGWTGSFRSFHGLDLLVRAFWQVNKAEPNCRLLLVGDGLERKKLQELVNELELSSAVIFAGRQSFADIPSYVSVFDIAVVSARAAEGFHYSPLKLREYMAAQCATLAPRAGEVAKLFRDEEELLLYTAGDEKGMCDKMLRLISDASLRKRIAVGGWRRVLENGTWDFELKKILNQLRIHTDEPK